jgi:DNA-binding NtrC family response regulator
MMTAYANVTDAVAAIKLGAFDYVAKPLDADEIALVVARAVEDRRRCTEPGTVLAPDEERPSDAEGLEPPVGFRHAVERARDRASRNYLVQLMALFHGNVTRAAKHARMTRESLHRVLKKHDVRSDDFKDHADDADDPGSDGLVTAG